MIKKIFLGFLLLVVLTVAAIYFVGSTVLNKSIKAGVETYGPRVTQTDVTLANVDLSILSGSGTLRGLMVGNPENYKSENIFSLEQIDLKIDTSTVFSDKVVIDHIIIERPEINYEKSLTSSNIKQLMANIEKFTGSGEKEPEAKTEAGPKKQVVIKKLIIQNGTIYAGAMGIGRSVPLPRIEMHNLGAGGEQMSITEVLDLVLAKVFQSIGPAISNAGELLKQSGQEALNKASKNATEKVNEAADDAINKAGDSIKSLLGK